jgi:hypothetical protein
VSEEQRVSDVDPIAPDDKDWTWVLQRPCPECGLDVAGIELGRVPDLIRANAVAWGGVLARADAARRPRPSVWSPLEYACHVRDVFRLYDERLALMLRDEDPTFANWDQDETAVADQYSSQDPGTVVIELADAAARVAASFEAVRPDQWSRTGRRSDGAVFTVASFARYFIHDPVHHLHDVAGVADCS